MNESTNAGVGAIAVNPAAEAEEIRSQPVQVHDDALRDKNGDWAPAKKTRDEKRAAELGEATRQATLDDRLRTRVEPHRSRGLGLKAQLKALDPRRTLLFQQLVMLTQALLNTRAVPNSTISPKQRFFSTHTKLPMIIGDTAVMATLLTRTGASIWLAILLGVSMATSTVMLGAKLGHQLAVEGQRRGRGAVPNKCPPETVAYYDDGGASTEFRRWLILGLAGTGALFFGVTLLGAGQGDPLPVALGFGLLAAVTFGGAAGAEAYGTNDAADARQDFEQTCNTLHRQLDAFEQLDYEATAEIEHADVEFAAAEHAAAAAGATVKNRGDRTPDNPHVFGYETEGSIAQPAPTPRGLAPVNGKNGGPARAAKSPRLTNPFEPRPEARNGKDGHR